MVWVSIILQALVLVGGFCLFLFIKNYLPSYMDEKGKNLATKEDIADITQQSESVMQAYRKEIEEFSADKRFKYDYYFKQYTVLYTKLYAIICQSEYVRHFIKLKDGSDFSFEEEPFIEIQPTEHIKKSFEFKDGKPVKAEITSNTTKTEISNFNKKMLCDLIVKHGEFASQKLLKLAVAYRFVYEHYTGNPAVINSDAEDIANEEEVRLIREIITCIVSECNFMRGRLKMLYNADELADGILRL